MAALTALAALDALDLSESATVLVVGATGGVGSFFVQLAAAAGAHVIAPALPEDHEYLRGLGAGDVIDRNADVAAQIRERYPDGVDALLDLAPLGAAGEGPGRANLMASPTTANLDRVAQLLEAGTLRAPIQDTYTLEQAGTALEALASAHTQGKLAITIA